MERLEVELIVDIAYRLWMGQPKRGIAEEMDMSRHTVRRTQLACVYRGARLWRSAVPQEAPTCPPCAS
jgi:hypothetical protein